MSAYEIDRAIKQAEEVDMLICREHIETYHLYIAANRLDLQKFLRSVFELF